MPGTSDAPIEIEPGPARQGDLLTFDEDGDLRLMVGTNPSQEMLVDSRVLCRASPIFRKMLRGPFAERKPEQGNWMIKLPEDSNDTFAVLMDLAHGFYIRVNRTITINELYKLCVLTNKYDMVSVLRPMEYHWYQSISGRMGILQCQTKYHREAMFILFELGYGADVRRMASALARSCPTNINGDFIDTNGVPLRNHEPFNMSGISNILERVTDKRNKTLASFKTECRGFMSRALEGIPGWRASVDNPNICSCPSRVSTNTIVGSMLSKAHELNIMGIFLPLAAEPDMTMSLFSLCRKLEAVGRATQDTCASSFVEMLMEKLENFECEVLTTEEEAYMRGQAAKVRMLWL